MSEPRDIAERALEQMNRVGFAAAQVNVSVSVQNELNLAHNQPSLLRSTEDHALALTGIVDGRKASATLSDLSDDAVSSAVQALIGRARLAPHDDANAVSSGQTANFEQGPASGDLDLLATKAREMLDFRGEHTPLLQIEEGVASHRVRRRALLTSLGTALQSTVGSYSLMVMGTATDGERSSSFNYTGGNANSVGEHHACDYFGLGEMMRDTERQIVTQPVGGNFVGEVVFAPTAVASIVGWLVGQLQDFALIADASIYKDHVGESIAAAQLSVRSRFDAPGHAAYTGDGFVAEPLTLVDRGTLTCLLPSLYGSRKTGLSHTPAASGWTIDAGDVPRAELASGINKGALVSRLSMGSPAANGDFSGVIKNSFLINDGAVGPALSETMISGNMSRMLNDIVGISRDRLDLGGEHFPWIRVAGLNFS